MIPICAESLALLTPAEQERLSRYKWRYVLAEHGTWTRKEAERLVFYRWLAWAHGINEGWPGAFSRSRRPRRLTGMLQVGRQRGRRHLTA